MEDVIISDAWDGVRRKLYLTSCVCGKEFYLPAHRMGRSRFCSKECAAKAQQKRVTMVCSTCGKVFERYASKVNASKSGLFFCSRQCKDKGQTLYTGIEEIQPD